MENRRNPLKEVRGLGIAHKGARDWMAVRLNSLALTFLYIWFIVSLFFLPDLSYTIVRGWLAAPLNAGLMALLVIATFWHVKYGLQELIDDYVHETGWKYVSICLNYTFVVGCSAVALVALLVMVRSAPG